MEDHNVIGKFNNYTILKHLLLYNLAVSKTLIY